MQTKFLRREYWLPPLAVLLFFSAAGSSLAFAQETLRAETCNADICYIKVSPDGFSPEKLLVRDGSTVVWKNVDNNAHMIAGGSTKNPALFNSSLLSSGKDYAFAFDAGMTGEFTYVDQSRNNASGKIIVAPRVSESPVKQVNIDLADQGSGIKVALTQGEATAAAAIPQLYKMTVWMDVPAPGVLKMTLDRRLIDSQAADKDAPFKVLVDGKAAAYREMPAAPEQRTLVMPVAEGAKTVSVVGRQMSVDMLGYGEAQAALDRAESGERRGGPAPERARRLFCRQVPVCRIACRQGYGPSLKRKQDGAGRRPGNKGCRGVDKRDKDLGDPRPRGRRDVTAYKRNVRLRRL